MLDLLKVVRDMIKPLLPKRRADTVEAVAKDLIMGLLRDVSTKIVADALKPEIKKQLLDLVEPEFEIISPAAAIK